MDAQVVLKRFFWLAFAVFLLASIPHVAYFFRAFEPVDGWWFWVIAYAIALSIDVTTFLLSLTASQLMHRKADSKIIVSVWFFVLLLAVLSWGMNWEYAYQFSSGMLVRPESIPFVNLINPIIASCFQALAIAYTWISDKIAQSVQLDAAQPSTAVQVNTSVQVCNLNIEQPVQPLDTVIEQPAQVSIPERSEQRARVLELAQTDKTRRTIAQEVGVPLSTVQSWIKGARDD